MKQVRNMILVLLMGVSSLTFAGVSDFELLVLPDQKVQSVVQVLDRAQKSLKLSMFHLSQPDLVDEVIALGSRGVKVQIILDRSILRAASSQAALHKIQASAGAANIEIKASTPGFSITHTKAFLIDNSSLFVSSINFSNAIPTSRDYGLIWSDANDIREFSTVFDSDWSLADGFTASTPTLSSDDLIWSPVNSKSKLLDLISETKHNLRIEVENLGAPEIQEAVKAAVARGVQVQVVMSLCTEGRSDRNWPFIDELSQAGAKVRVMPEARDASHPYIHAKLILADDDAFYLGSENFSVNSLDHAREVGVLTHSTAIVGHISPVFTSDWNAATEWNSIPHKCSITN